MKVKFGDLTVKEAASVCGRIILNDCQDCPLVERPFLCKAAKSAMVANTLGDITTEIDLPDEEVKEK